MPHLPPQDLDGLVSVCGGKSKTKLEPNLHEVSQEAMVALLHQLISPGFQCSMFAAWGSRTQSGQLYSGQQEMCTRLMDR